MKKILLVLIVLTSSFCHAQTIDWYYTTDTVTMAGWPALDVNIPAGMRIDSVYGGFQRSGVTVASEDWACDFEGNSPWNYNDSNTTLYNHWINLTSFNFVGPGVFRAAIPNGANPATWDSLGVATSSVVGVAEIHNRNELLIYPNPVSSVLYIDSKESIRQVAITDLTGNVVRIYNQKSNLSVEHLPTGMYFLSVFTDDSIKYTRFIKK